MRPLDGLRIADLTSVLAGPYGTMHLGDLEHQSITVERPVSDVHTRTFAPPSQGHRSAWPHSYTRWLSQHLLVVTMDALCCLRPCNARTLFAYGNSPRLL